MTRARARVGGAGSTALAFLLAPLATLPAIAGVLGLAWVLGLGSFAGAPLFLFLNSLAAFALFGMPLAYLTALVLGIPAYAMARRFRLLGFGHSLAIGASVALLPLWLYFAWVAAIDGAGALRDAGTAMGWTVLFAACGASSGATFWWIAIRAAGDQGPGSSGETATRP